MLDDLKAFVAVIDGKSLTRAAARLHLTQSAVSRRIQQLEESLGATLLDRAQRPPLPTALGRRIYEQALPILRGIEDLVALPRETAPPTGTLRLGITPAVGDLVLTGLVGRIRTGFPALDLRLRTDWSTGLSAEVRDGALDGALVILPGATRPAAPLAGAFIAALDLVVVQSRRQPLYPEPVRLAQLAEAGWILNPVGCGYRAGLEHAMGERHGMLSVVIDTFGAETQLRLVAAGLGLGLVPRQLLRSSAAAGEVTVVEIGDFAMQVELWLVRGPRSGNLIQALDALAGIVSSVF